MALGVYASRQEESNGVTLEHLVFIPLSGGGAQVLLRSRPTLRFSHFAVWSPPGAPARDREPGRGTFTAAGAVSGKLSKPNGLGLVVADALGTVPVLLRQDLEAFPYTDWSLDGSGVLVGGTRSGNAWTIDMAGKRRVVGASLQDLRVAAWSYDGRVAVLSDTPTTRLVTLDYASGGVASTRYVGSPAKAARR